MWLILLYENIFRRTEISDLKKEKKNSNVQHLVYFKKIATTGLTQTLGNQLGLILSEGWESSPSPPSTSPTYSADLYHVVCARADSPDAGQPARAPARKATPKSISTQTVQVLLRRKMEEDDRGLWLEGEKRKKE